MTKTHAHNRSLRAFTLLEVLISVVVLAFGLLGVVAVFPAVIDLQRRAQDAVIGGASAASAEAVLRAAFLDAESLDWAEDFDLDDVPKSDRYPVGRVLTDDLYMSVASVDRASETVEVDFLWEVDWSWRPLGGAAIPNALRDDGRLVLGNSVSTDRGFATLPLPNTVALNGRLPAVEIPLADRLLPDAASGGPPRYVWDAVVRRVDTGLGFPRNDSFVSRDVPVSRVRDLPVEIAIFVRPIDRGIRTPPGLSLRDVLSGFTVDENGDPVDLDDDQRSFPVTVSDEDLVTRRLGVRLGDGNNAAYSVPVSMQVLTPRTPVFQGQNDNATTVSVLDLDRLVPENDVWDLTRSNDQAEAMRNALAQVGQLFVDNLGVVHRVTQVREDGFIEFEPPLSDPGSARGRVSQIVFTPQVPADIRVIRTR